MKFETPHPAVLVTGASTGIGEACTLGLAKLGYRVYAGIRRSEDAHRLSIASSLIVPILLDVTNKSQIATAVSQIQREVGEGGLLGIVNNAGIAVAGPLEFLPVDDLRRQLETNVIGLHAVTQAFLPMLRASRGRIVHISSTNGRLSTPFTGAYAASKFAVEALADAMRRELHGTGIEISVIQPGTIATPIWEKSSEATERMVGTLPPEAHEHYGKSFDTLRAVVQDAVRRADPPEVVFRAVLHALTAASPRTRYPVGSTARLQVFLARFVPDRLLDWTLLKAMGLR